MDNRLTKSFVDRLPEAALIALGGNARFVHPSTGATQWLFGTLHKDDGVDTLTVNDAGDASDLGDLLVVVAMSDNSDALLIRDDRKMTCMYWYHDDHSLEKIPVSIAQWLDDATRIDIGAMSDDDPQVRMPKLLVGQWQPQKVLTPGMKGHLKTVPGIEVLADGKWIEHWTWPSKSTLQHQVVQMDDESKCFDVNEGGDVLRYHFRFESDDRLVLIGPDPDYKVEYQRTT